MFNFIKNSAKKVKENAIKKYVQVQLAVENKRAEGYVDTGVKILIAVVIGALLLGGLYLLFNSTIMPTVTKKIKALFNYSGT